MQSQSRVIVVPVWESKVSRQAELFKFTNIEAINNLNNKVNNFEEIKLKDTKKNKVRVIASCEKENVHIDEVPCLLLNIAYYDTNLEDMSYEREEKIEIEQNDKLWHDKHYFLFYPRIEGNTTQSSELTFYILGYEDPSKSKGSLNRIIKEFCKRTLALDIKKVILKNIESELEDVEVIDSIKVKEINDSPEASFLPSEFADYIVKHWQENMYEFKQFPGKKIVALIKRVINACNHKQKIDINSARGNFRVNTRRSDINNGFETMIEKIYNIEITVDDNKEIDKLKVFKDAITEVLKDKNGNT